MEAEHLDADLEVAQGPPGQARPVVRLQAALQDRQIRQQLGRTVVVAALARGEAGAAQPLGDDRQGAAIGLVRKALA